jgi:hypothetical protein
LQISRWYLAIEVQDAACIIGLPAKKTSAAGTSPGHSDKQLRFADTSLSMNYGQP